MKGHRDTRPGLPAWNHPAWIHPAWIRHGLSIAVFLVAVSPAYPQGALTPPGAPAPTMITLDQIEPRTPIPGGTNTVLLDTPGSYYLAGNLVTTGTAIQIIRNHITLDLNGFTVTGTATSGVSDIGVWIKGTKDDPRANVTVKSGVIHGFVNSVWLDHTVGCRLDRIVTEASRGSSIYIDGSDGGPSRGNMITHCNMANGLRGIRLYGTNGECSGNLFVDCAISSSSDQAVLFDPNNGQVSGNIFRGCSVSDAFYSCVYIVPSSGGECHGNTFDRCTFTKTANGNGINVFTIGGTFNGNVIRGCAMSDVSAAVSLSTGSTGECMDNRIEECTIHSTRGYSALWLTGGPPAPVAGNLIAHNVVRAATEVGLYLVGSEDNRIEANHFSGPTSTSTTYGVYSQSTLDNVIVKNSSAGADINFAPHPNDTYGPIVSTTGLLSDTGDDSHPWANYGF